MNSDLISRDAVEDLIMEIDPWWCEGTTRAIFEGVKRLPTIDTVKHGKWTYDDESNMGIYARGRTMNDLISRQAAIDQIECLMDDKTKVHYNHGCADAIATLKNIPPAQQWIPVEERLPEKEDYYLLTIKSLTAEAGSVVISRPYNGGGGFCDVHWKRVIAWMPLPEPFKEVE